MQDNRRSGRRKGRDNRFKRMAKLGYYLIVTDPEKTEEKYLIGLRDSIPAEFQEKLVLIFNHAKTSKIIDEAKSAIALHPQYGEPWIIFDKDQIADFDKIIERAEQEGIHVGWSNPCIETWFSAYFGSMPIYQESVKCWKGFGEIFVKKATQKYVKADTLIYDKLCRYGDEEKAIHFAERRLRQGNENHESPSLMLSTTTIHILVKQITEKIERK